MKKVLGAAFKVRPGEGLRVFQFVFLFLLIQAGTAIGIAASDSLFLLHVGPEELPKVYVLLPLVMLIYIPISSFITTRFGLSRFFWITMLTLGGGGIFFWWALQGLPPPPGEGEEPSIQGAHRTLLFAAKIYAAAAFVALYSQSWNFAYQFFTILQGKRLFAFFTGGSALGAIFAGVLINALPDSVHVTALYVIWAGLAVLSLPMLAWISSTAKVIDSDTLEEDDSESGSFLEQTTRLARIIKGSRYVLIVLAVLFLAQVLTTLNEYQYLDIFSREYTDPTELAALFGWLYIWVNTFNLFVSLFLFNRLVLRFGVRNVALLQPLVYIVAFSWFYLEYGLIAGFFGYFAYQGLMVAIDYDNTNLLLNALPSEAKAQVRTFIEGMAEPLATATAGLFLLSLGSSLERSTLSLLGLAGGILYLLLVLNLRYQYVGAMVSNLRKSWLDFSRDAFAIMRSLAKDELDLLKDFARGRDLHAAPAAITILRENDEPEAAKSLLDFMSHTPPEDRKEAGQLFSELLRRDDDEIFRLTLDWLDRDRDLIDTELVQEICAAGLPRSESVYRLVKSPGPRARATIGLQLLNSWKIEDRSSGLRMFERLFGENHGEMAAAIEALGRSEEERYAHFVAPCLNHESPEIRREALTAIHRLVDRQSGRLLPELLDLIQRGDPEQRRLAVESLARIGEVDSIAPLLRLADSMNAAERRKAEAVVESVGLQGVPMAVSVCRDRSFPFRGRAIAARALSRLAFPQFEEIYLAIIQPEIELAYRSLYRYDRLRLQEGDCPGIRVLSQLFLDSRSKIIEFILEILSLAGRLPDFELISASLRSINPKERGNAIETIEQGVEQDLFQQLLPLIDSRPLEDRISYYRQHYQPSEISPTQIVLDALAGNFPTGCMAAATALQELEVPDFSRRLRKRILEIDSPRFRSVALSLLGIGEEKTHLVERIDLMRQSTLFGSFPVVALEIVADSAREVSFPAGQKIEMEEGPASFLFCVIEGSARTEPLGGQNGETFSHGQVFGEGCLFGEESRPDFRSGDCFVLAVPREAVWQAVDLFPETALCLLEFAEEEKP